MIKLDDDLLVELGLGSLSPDDKKRMLTHIYETLEMRVGMELAKQMTDAQLNEFEQFINRNDEPGALRWLETNFPNYKQVVAAEFDKLKAEIKQVAPQILQDAMANPTPPAPQPMAQPMPGQMPPAPPQPQYTQPSTPMPPNGGYAPYPQQPTAQQPMPSYQQPVPAAPATPQSPATSQPAPYPQQQATMPQQPQPQPYVPQQRTGAQDDAASSDDKAQQLQQ